MQVSTARNVQFSSAVDGISPIPRVGLPPGRISPGFAVTDSLIQEKDGVTKQTACRGDVVGFHVQCCSSELRQSGTRVSRVWAITLLRQGVI